MGKPTSGTSRISGFAVALLLVTALIELFVVALASAGFDEVAQASPFGRPGTATVAAAVAVVAAAGAFVAWRGASTAVRVSVVTAVFAAVGVVALMALFFVVAGGSPIILAVLLALTAVSVAMIGRAVLQAAPRTSES
ncbi:hypothetical protein OWR29_39225 [Actinoplanes sp. Pm04-4]|uniref:Integral membrane protein n=1 Tax=Paractinoplanes pyxinae TaxID=2997416 RepID=A0ABT4BC14_9ACTN|nr:hypothetical protein [Actinoplanes pyxinae]MCY1144064.1 hypothetical protein [Actinoplanes pyxinae]